MVFPRTNLPSLSGHGHYTLVHYLPTNPTDPAHKLCDRKHVHEDEYYGFSVSILRPISDTVLVKVRHYRRDVRMNNGKYERKNKASVTGSIFSIFANESSVLSSSLIRATQAALYGSRWPQRLGPMYDFINAIYTADEDISTIEITAATAMIQQITTVNGHPRKSMPPISDSVLVLLSDHTNCTRDMYRCINNTYVNIVHNCERMCVQSVLSDNVGFMSEEDVDNYGLLCMHRLLAIDNSIETQHSTQNVINITKTHNDIYKECETCVLSATNIAINTSVIICSIFALFIAFRNSKCAKVIHENVLRISRTMRGTSKIHCEDDTQRLEEIYDEQNEEASL